MKTNTKIIIALLLAVLVGFFVFNNVSNQTSSEIVSMEETAVEGLVTEVVQEEEAPAINDEQSYCTDLRSRNLDQAESNIIVEPLLNNKIVSGQQISGCVYNVSGSYGGWAPFEAQVGSFHLRDDNNEAIASGPLSVAGEDWMTRAMNSESLQFSGTISFDQKEAGVGVLLLKNENASGEPEMDKTLSQPIIF